MRKTKIVCSIGPASESEEVLRGLCLAGMNVARLNFSHGTYEEHQRRIDAIKKVRNELNLPIAIMLDTKGPEFRIKTFADGKIMLEDGDKFTFTTDEVIGDQTKVSVTYKKLNEELSAGDKILLNNGLLIFSVDSVEGNDINCTVICGGELSDRKSMSFPGKHLKQPYLSEQDKADLLFGVKNEVDYVACSFVSCKQDMVVDLILLQVVEHAVRSQTIRLLGNNALTIHLLNKAHRHHARTEARNVGLATILAQRLLDLGCVVALDYHDAQDRYTTLALISRNFHSQKMLFILFISPLFVSRKKIRGTKVQKKFGCPILYVLIFRK